MGREAHEIADNYIAQVWGTTCLNLVWGVKKGREKGWLLTPSAHNTAVSVILKKPHPSSSWVCWLGASSFHFNNLSLSKTLDCSPEGGEDPCANNSVMLCLFL